jgi:transmembrane sensor
VTAGSSETPAIEAALADALRTVATRCGRLSDEQVRSLRRRRRSAIAAVAAAPVTMALLFVSGDWFVGTPTAPMASTRVFATRAGERSIAMLADGSTVSLNGATQLRVVYTQGQRRAELLKGQAFFDVRHDASRPFVVRTGASDTRVLGTAFDLDLTQGQVALAVYRGAVGFDPVGVARGVVVRAGYRSAVRGGVAAAPTRFDPVLPDWRKGWIDTTGMRLDDLVEVLDRQGGIRIARPAEPLASTTVFGRFRTDHPHQLLNAIGSGFGFTVIERQETLTLETAH